MKIVDWILDLVRNEEAFDRFKFDARTEIEASDLTRAQKDVLLSRDPERIRHVIEFELEIDPGSAAYAMHLVVPGMHGVPPPPPPPPPSPDPSEE